MIDRLLAASLLVTFATCVASIACAPLGHAADETVWIEAEQPTSKSPSFTVPAIDPVDRGTLSGGAMIQLDVGEDGAGTAIPEAGALLGFGFTTAVAGAHAIWERVVSEPLRSPFEWRLDDGAWAAIPAQTHPFIDLIPVGGSQVAWMKLGDADLAAGKHRLDLRVQRQYGAGKKPQRTLHAADCFCVATAFSPDGRNRPDPDTRSETERKADRAAAAQVFMAGLPRGERSEAPLAGAWEATRFEEWMPADRTAPDRELPQPAEQHWHAITVPGYKSDVRPDLALCHRLVYRTHVMIPAELAGHAFVLRFPAVSMIASAIVNGSYCGSTKAMLAEWDCDITAAAKPGVVNEVCVVIKDPYYGFDPRKCDRPWPMLACVQAQTLIPWIGNYEFSAMLDFPVALNLGSGGIPETPTLVVCGGIYAADVFARPSVSTKSLALDVTLRNPGAAPVKATLEVAIEPAAGGKPEKTFASRQVDIPAASEVVVSLSEPWTDARLWWPDDPQLYRAVARVVADGGPADVSRTEFGFREWGWSTDQITLNGIPWHFRADITDTAGATPDEAAQSLRERGQNLVRMLGYTGWHGLGPKDSLTFFDRAGLVTRRCSIFDGEGATAAGLADRTMYDNLIAQNAAWIRSERNHPSVLMWTVQNEIAAANFRDPQLTRALDAEITRVGKAAMALDPTRPAMAGGGRCLTTQELPINGCHFDETFWREYPDEAYTNALAMKSHLIPWTDLGPSPWPLTPGRPIFHAEAFYMGGLHLAEIAQIGGEEAFTGQLGCRRGGGLMAKMLIEGYRWNGVSGFQLWLNGDLVDSYASSLKPVAALCREWNWTFAGAAQVERSFKILNDTRSPEPIEFSWEATSAGKRFAGVTTACDVPPGGSLPVAASFQTPAVVERTPGEMTLICRRAGKEVFRDVKPLWLIAADGAGKPSLQASELAVIDPHGEVAARLTSRGVPFTALKSAKDVPDTARVVVVGPDALDPLAATSNEWMAIAARGGRVLVLDQTNPLQASALPADMTPTDFAGRVAFIENRQHPAFASLDQPDLFTWSGDHLVYRHAYTKPSRGATSLVQCDRELGCSCMAECRINDGVIVLSQVLVGTKLAHDPVAQRLFDNLLAYCASFKPLRKSTTVVFDEAAPEARLLKDIGLAFDRAADPLEAVKAGRSEIVVFAANPANLKSLASDLKTVMQFTRRGGWLFAWGLTQDGLADFDKLVGVEHLIRPFRGERVTMPPLRNAVMSGLTMRDVVMERPDTISGYNQQRISAPDAFTAALDFDDIAPFCQYPSGKVFGANGTGPALDKDPYNLVNGYDSSVDWRVILQIPVRPESLEWDVTLPREEELTEFDIIPNGNYKYITRIELTCDGDWAHLIPIPLKPQNTLQTFALPPHKVKVLHVKIAAIQEKDTGDLVGIDNWWIKVKRSGDFYDRVKPLLSNCSLMKYPQGQGGVVLSEINLPAQELNPENAVKKRTITAALLRNLGAVFAGGRSIVAGTSLMYEPVQIDAACNQFITLDKGWFTDEKHDLGLFPSGDPVLAGVAYRLRPSHGSPLRNAISLDDDHLAHPLPPEVTGIPLGRKAAALFFLHTAKLTAPWFPKDRDSTPPVVWRYVIRYADGQTIAVPVRYNDGVGHWLQQQPRGLANAVVVAWTGAFEQDGSGEQAVVYQMQWTNPRPDSEIASIDITYDPEAKSRYGVPVVLAITAATPRQ